MKNKKKFLLLLTTCYVSFNSSIQYTSVLEQELGYTNNNVIEVTRHNASSSGSSGSSNGSTGIYGATSPDMDATKVATLGTRMEKFIKKGDIFIDPIGAIIKIGFIKYNTGHAGVVTDTYYNDNGDFVVKTIEALGKTEGIKEIELNVSRLYNGYIYRVPNLTDDQIKKVIYFNEQQVGKEYKFKIWGRNTDINSTTWYCSELVVASFKYATGIDLGDNDKTQWIKPTNIGANSHTKKLIDSSVSVPTICVDNNSNHTINCGGDSFIESHDYLFDDHCRGCDHQY